MAEDIAIRLDVATNAAASSESVKELKKSLKELIDLQAKIPAGSAHFKKLADSINETEDRMSGLNDQFQTLRGSGVERLESSVGLLSEGFTKFDTGKIAAGFKGIGAAMSAIPIFLIIEGFKLLMENIDEVIAFFKELIGSTDSYAKEIEALKRAHEDLNSSIDAQILALSGLKVNEEIIIKLKRQKLQLLIDEKKLALEAALANQQAAEKEIGILERLLSLTTGTNVAEIKHQADILKAKGETKKATQELETSLASLQGFDNVATQKQIDNAKKLTDEKKKEEETRRANTIKAFAESLKEENQQETELNNLKFDDKNKAISENYVKQNELQDAQDAINAAKRLKEFAEIKEFNKQVAAAEQSLYNAKFAIAQQGIAIGAQLFAKNKQAANAFFLLDRGVAAAKVFIDAQREIAGYKAAYAAIPGGTAISAPLAISAKIRAALSIASILATTIGKFAGGGGGGSVEVGSAGNINTANVQTQAPVITTPNNTTTQLADTANKDLSEQPVIKAVVVETDLTDKQKKIKSIQEQATFG